MEMKIDVVDFSKPSVLVVSPDVTSLMDIRAISFENRLLVMVAEDLNDARSWIENLQNHIVGIFVQLAGSLLDGISVIRASRLNRPLIPLFLIEGDPNLIVGLGEKSLQSLGVSEVLQLPLQVQRLNEIFGRLSSNDRSHLCSESSLAYAQHNLDARNESEGAEDSEEDGFFPIHALDLLASDTAIFDVYLKMKVQNVEKYLKIVHAGDEFDVSRIEDYLRKGVSYFYVRKEVQEPFLKFCDHIISLLVR